MNLFAYLNDHILITDGAMGTYYAELTDNTVDFCEFANLSQPEKVQKIHTEYIAAGAQLIRTNTFSANPSTLNLPQAQVQEIIARGYQIAQQAAKSEPIFIAANIGPLPEFKTPGASTSEELLAEYRWIIDTFLNCGATIFNFETFSSLDYLAEISAYIKSQRADAFVMTLFTVNPDGFTRKGIGMERILQQVKQLPSVDSFGFNCGAGPSHLYHLLKNYNFTGEKVAVLPNAGFPEVINERTLYVQNPSYFAERIQQLKTLGIKILGGCCGTTPSHIHALNRLNTQPVFKRLCAGPSITPLFAETPQIPNPLAEKLQQGEFIVAAELDPPFDTTIAKTMDRAHIYRNANVDLITIADSPLAKPRADSIAVAAKIKRELGIETLPHLCCRDRNSNALKSAIIGAHIEGIRNILAVTGDPLPKAAHNPVKSVFNLNSIELIELLSELNQEVFASEPLLIGGALNLNVRHKEQEIFRMTKKAAKGATLFLTQPIFSSEVIQFLTEFKKAAGIKLLGGILPIVNYNNALFLKNEVPGMSLPDELIQRFEPAMDRETAEQTGIELAVEIGAQIKPFVDGFYIMTPFNRAAMVVKILNQLGL